MPKELHDRLKRIAQRRGYSQEREDAYVYGTLNKVDRRRTAKGLRKKKLNRR